jgi:hypothetical protein
MIISEITLSYPCIRHKVEVSHFTARKSTAIEWVILEVINKCDTLQQYTGIPISVFFEQIFSISDADLLIRPCLIDLHDMGAISIPGIDNETELSTIPMGNLKLTKTGKEMQMQGLLPGTTAEDTFTIYYDLISKTLREDSLLYKENATGIKVMDADEIDYFDFPASAIREWLVSIQENKRRNRMNWLSPTTKIQDITSLESDVLWKNIARKVDLTYGMQWRIVGEENEAFHEISLIGTDLPYPDEMRNLPKLSIVNPDDEIEQLVPVSEVNTFIGNYQLKDDLFLVDEKYYTELRTDQLNKRKKPRVGFVFGADSLEVSSKGKQLIVHLPDDIGANVLYRNAKAVVQAGIITVVSGNTAKDMAIAYVPKETQLNLAEELLPYVDKYYEKDSTILFALIEMGLRELFLKYVERLVKNEINIGKKAEVIDLINAKSVGYYNQKLVSSMDKERLVINAGYISERCKCVSDATSILEEFSAVNSLRQDESLIQRVIQIILESIGEMNDLNEIWSLWSAIGSIKKSHINWINKNGLYRGIYASTSISDLLGKFSDDELFSVEEYTPVEQIILNMKRICIQIQELLPDMDMYAPVSDEKYSEVVINHMDSLSSLYDLIRQWRDEEEKFSSKIMDIESVVPSGCSYAIVKANVDGLRNALARFFDDSVMKYNKVYIVDTCTLMHEPGLISWFDGENALLVVPLVVLDELDEKKQSDDESEAFSARDAIRNINNYRAYEWLNTGEKSYPELLSDDLDKERNDNKILSIALRYSVKKPIILTDDINFGNIADAHKIENMTLNSYRAMKEHEKLSKKGNGKKHNKKKK